RSVVYDRSWSSRLWSTCGVRAPPGGGNPATRIALWSFARVARVEDELATSYDIGSKEFVAVCPVACLIKADRSGDARNGLHGAQVTCEHVRVRRSRGFDRFDDHPQRISGMKRP